ncbi:MAG: anti-sigma factor [Bryobacteraceae bacterium]|jgi:anti-sigma factor RsiW
MNCESAKPLIESYLDDELDAAQAGHVQEHLADCSSCAQTHAQYLEQWADIRAHAPYYNAPAHFPDLIRGALRQADSGAAEPWRWIAIAASILLAVSLVWNIARFQSRDSSAALTAQDVLSSHIRSLIGTHLLDVPSSDRHTVKPWFNGKLDFSPDVKDFASQGFPLIGGRIDYVDGRAVAALVYQRRQHVMNLFTWPGAAPGSGAETARNGYHTIHWNGAGMTYWAVSDLGIGELQQFASLYKQ